MSVAEFCVSDNSFQALVLIKSEISSKLNLRMLKLLGLYRVDK